MLRMNWQLCRFHNNLNMSPFKTVLAAVQMHKISTLNLYNNDDSYISYLCNKSKR